jgi:hypothetical protein
MSRENLSLSAAVLVSVLLHALVFGGFRQLSLRLPHRRAAATMPVITFVQVAEPPAVVAPKPIASRTEPREFVETDARQVTGEQPQATAFYSDKATVAANPENPTGKLGDTPFLSGTDTRVHSTEDVPLPTPAPAAMPVTPQAARDRRPPEGAAPSAPPPVTAPLGTRVVEPATTPVTAPAAPVVVAKAQTPGAASPREIVARKAALTATGVARTGVAAFNVAASPFGEYDKKVVRAVQSRWFALIDRNDIYERSGVVALHFKLYTDGSVPRIERSENTAGEILALFCEKAILESAPFEPFPASLRALVGNEPRDVDFTFYY